ncbi:hypothetical protein PHLGIDRAFT_411473 [Phlebiopsis gigantea 11061_1 CR5-6]|uniref:Uncharacterized protein n=1 Tax=Phlebiopsis gigantea (strain 11061_1 CR5-6) TaxID=745531 RepID=A0A0C3SB55_PHLG1|nr:hypothetical protein PHLGIDRAFT_411473 [Phlebiopsis gigantea 11061_1 CR5-6]
MEPRRHTLSLSILQAYYPVVKTLSEYLRGAVAFNKGHAEIGLTHETDSYAYRKLLESCIVATKFQPEQSMRATPIMSHLREVLERAQVKILGKGYTPNVLTAGYRIDQRREGDTGPGRSMLRNYFVNTLTTVFEGSDWAALYERWRANNQPQDPISARFGHLYRLRRGGVLEESQR